jgi:3-oxoacyl-[acyl-carrier protein] reductase
MEFKDKIVLITGASRGIGKATALAFAKEGAKVIINYIKSKKEAQELNNEINKISEAIAIKCDVSKEKQVKKMFDKIKKKFGRVDILVNNAGTYFDGDEWNGNEKIWEKTLKVDLISVMNVSKYATEIFLKQKSGVIVNISSRYSLSGVYDSLAYSAAKAGVANVTQSYSKLLAPFGRAVAISPGATKAGYWLRAPKEEIEALVKQGKKFMEPEEVAKKVLEVASNNSKLNGENILITANN